MSGSPRLTLRWVAETLGLAFDGEDREVSLTTDSRQAGPSCVFVPVVGEKMDGHQFVESAAQAGAVAIVLRANAYQTEWADRFPKTRFFRVDDTLDAYRRLGAAWRARFTVPVVCVAGSAGKTTTKEMLAAMLSGKFRSVLKTVGSQNGFLGIPMTLLELRPSHQAAVIEVGIDEIGAMDQHLEIVRPTHAILTAIGPEHLEKLVDLATVTREELRALQWTQAHEGQIAINLEDPAIQGFAGAAERARTFGLKPHAWAAGQLDGARLTITRAGAAPFTLECPLPGAHNAVNCLGAATVALQLGLSSEEITRGLASFAGADGRSQTTRLKTSRPGGTLVVCDYYNAQPASMRAAFSLLQPGSVLCLGEMRELGAQSEKLHRELAADVAGARPSAVFLLGAEMKHLEAALRAKGFSAPLQHFGTHEEMARAVRAINPPPAEILIKGSRGLTMEKVLKLLQAGA